MRKKSETMRLPLLFLLMLLSGSCTSWPSSYRSREQLYELAEYKAYACENYIMVMECPRGRDIKVKRANYGRSDDHTCDPTLLRINSNLEICVDDGATDVVATQCNNQPRCQFTVNNRMFGDTCPNTYKFLEVDFVCEISASISDEVQHMYACEGNIFAIECPHGTHAVITRANYGRSSDTICDPRLLPPVDTLKTCVDNAATEIVATFCEYQMRCGFRVTNSIFTDTCPNVYKFLEVDYVCEKDTNSCTGKENEVPQYGTPQYGTPQNGTPQNGTPQNGTPQNGDGGNEHGAKQQTHDTKEHGGYQGYIDKKEQGGYQGYSDKKEQGSYLQGYSDKKEQGGYQGYSDKKEGYRGFQGMRGIQVDKQTPGSSM